MFTFWQEADALAVSEGFSALRVIGATEWVIGGAAGLERWIEYGKQIDSHALGK
jgi:hypothetical protein